MSNLERFPRILPKKGRGAVSNEVSRYQQWRRAPDHEYAESQTWDDEAPPKLKTVVWLQHAKSIVSTNDTPDIPFDASVNPYQSCEYGCGIYQHARKAPSLQGGDG